MSYEVINNVLTKFNDDVKIEIIDDNVLEIGPGAFLKSKELEEIVLPKSVTEIGDDTFVNCKNLKKIVVNVKTFSMAKKSIKKCPNLEEVCIFSEDVKSLPRFDSLNEKHIAVIMPNTKPTALYVGSRIECLIDTIEAEYSDKIAKIAETSPFHNYVKENYKKLLRTATYYSDAVLNYLISYKLITSEEVDQMIKDLSIELPDYLKETAVNHKIVLLNYKNEVFKNHDSTELTVEKKPLSIAEIKREWGYSTEKRHNLDGLSLTRHLGVIGSVVAPSYIGKKPVVSIGEGLFQGNMSVETIFLPSTIKCIKDRAFNGSFIKSVTIESDEIEFGMHSFLECKNLINVALNAKKISTSIHPFAGCNNIFNNDGHLILKEDDLDIVVDYDLSKMPTTLVLPNNVVRICDYSFANSGPHSSQTDNLVNLIIPQSIKRIGWYCFDNYKSLKKVTIEGTLEYIGQGSFCNCDELEEIHILGDINSIEADVFTRCNKLNIYGKENSNIQKIAKQLNINFILE